MARVIDNCPANSMIWREILQLFMLTFVPHRRWLFCCRPGSGNSIAALVAGSPSMRPGSPGYEAKEAAAVPLRQVGVGPVRLAAAALSDLQVGVLNSAGVRWAGVGAA